MKRRTYDLSLQDCNIIIRKCRIQIARTDGTIAAIKQIKKGIDADSIYNKARNARNNYKARLNELLSVRATIQEDGDADRNW